VILIPYVLDINIDIEYTNKSILTEIRYALSVRELALLRR